MYAQLETLTDQTSATLLFKYFLQTGIAIIRFLVQIHLQRWRRIDKHSSSLINSCLFCCYSVFLRNLLTKGKKNRQTPGISECATFLETLVHLTSVTPLFKFCWRIAIYIYHYSISLTHPFATEKRNRPVCVKMCNSK